MIYIGILDISGIDPTDKCLISKIPEEARGRVEKTKNINEKTLRTGAYVLLSELYKRFFGKETPRIIYTGDGKPFFEGKNNENKTLQSMSRFNISHDEIISAVAICDENLSIGIDVQSVSRGKVRVEKIADRFLASIRNFDTVSNREGKQSDLKIDEASVTFIYYIYKNGALFEVPYTLFSSTEPSDSDEGSDFLKKWTFLESVLKMSGRGFGDISSAERLIAESKSKTVTFARNNRLYALSVSIEKQL